MAPNSRMAAAILVPALAAAAALAQGDEMAFIPPGGRTILLERLAPSGGAELAAIAAREAGREEWADWAREADPEIGEAEAGTFAGYAELNFPLAEDALMALAESGDAELLPPDGKDLAVAQCQFCHSLFSGYLMHERDETGWRGTFKSPFHSEIPMTETERDTFARYSAINMPLEFEDVPPEFRF